MWVCSLIHLFEFGYTIVGITLGCSQRGVTHQLLDIAHISLLIHQVGCEGVAQYVWGFFTLYICSTKFALYDALYRCAR